MPPTPAPQEGLPVAVTAPVSTNALVVPATTSIVADADGNEPGKLFIGGLSQATTEASLRAHFSQFGQLESAVVMMDNQSGRSRGFGFVKFKEVGSVAAALQWGREHRHLDGKEVDVKQSNIHVRGSRAAQTRHLKVFVGGIVPDADAQTVQAYFSQYGRVADVNLMLDQARQRHRGFAFVTFEDERVVQRLVQLHFVDMGGRLVEVKAMKPPGSAGSAPSQQQLQQQQHLQQQQQQQSLLQSQHLYFQPQLLAQQQSSLTSRCVGGPATTATALPLLTATATGCQTATVSCWQPVAFDPSPGLAWAAWTDHQQQHQQHHHCQHHLSFVDPAWLPQPLLAAAATATSSVQPSWSSLLSLQPLRQQQQEQQQEQSQHQHSAAQESDPAGNIGSFAWHFAVNKDAPSAIGVQMLHHQQLHQQSQLQSLHQQQQQRILHQEHLESHHNLQQLLLQSRAAGDFGSSRSA